MRADCVTRTRILVQPLALGEMNHARPEASLEEKVMALRPPRDPPRLDCCRGNSGREECGTSWEEGIPSQANVLRPVLVAAWAAAQHGPDRWRVRGDWRDRVYRHRLEHDAEPPRWFPVIAG